MRKAKSLLAAVLKIYAILSLIVYLFLFMWHRSSHYVTSIPYMDYIMEFAGNVSGIVFLAVVPAVILFLWLIVRLADIKSERSRHRKRILRRKKRRNERYLKEGLYTSKKAVI